MNESVALNNDIRELNMTEIVTQVAEMLKDNRARDVVVLDLNGLTTITDFFIICTANSTIQTKALLRQIEEFMRYRNIKPYNKNISTESPWVLIDYNYFVIHIFLKEGREFYQLEKLWIDAKVMYFHKGGAL